MDGIYAGNVRAIVEEHPFAASLSHILVLRDIKPSMA